MQWKKLGVLFIIIALSVVLSGGVAAGEKISSVGWVSSVSWAPVEQALGAHGDVSPDGAVSFDLARNLTVTVDGIRLAPGSDLSHEVHMMNAGNKTLVVGEIVLKENEVKGVTQKLLQAGLEETALHNHLLRTTPHLVYLHIHGHGDAVQLATSIREIADSLEGGTITPADTPVQSQGINVTKMDDAMGYQSKQGGGVYIYEIPRADNISMDGITLLPEMDISTGISFQPIGDGKAAVVGEFVLESSEVGPVIDSMTKNGIEVTALHSHMLTERPQLFYLHCWATGDAVELARGMHDAVSLTDSQRGG